MDVVPLVIDSGIIFISAVRIVGNPAPVCV
jgi:hypothetical protein